MSELAGDPGAHWLAAAQGAMQAQQWPQAAQHWDRLIAEQPTRVDARVGRARCAMLLGQPAQAVSHLQAALASAPDNVAVARSLGVAWLACGDLIEAIASLQQARALAPQDAQTLLHLGQALERQGRRLVAAQIYYRALLAAQSKGEWLNPASTPPMLRAAVVHAMDVVDRERPRALDALLAPWREQHGAAALTRVQRCLDAHLKRLTLTPPDPQQRPRFLYVPDLPAPRYFERALFEWIAPLEAASAGIRAEAEAVLQQADALQPFLSFDSAEQVGQYLGSADTPPAWDAYFFYRDGRRYDAHHLRCPLTSATLEALPLVRIREHAPEICYSVLAPGTHILPHTGVSNLRVVVHLPLIVPADCAIEVAGQTHAWREGEVVVFDDSYEHQAWNRGGERRVILLMDTWNPYLTPVEREALSALVAGIGDFNRAEL